MEKARKIAQKGKTHANGFMDFIRDQGVVGLAIGLVVGGAVTVVAKSFIDNVVMPPVGLLLGSAEGLKGLSVTIGHADGKAAVLKYGVFLNDFINFLVIALIVYIVVRMLRLDKKR